MKRINEYKKLFSVEKEIDLKKLKTSYRNLVKQWHPDKFQENDPKAEEAKAMSLQIIDGYHFLVSIAPETKAANLEEYTQTITTSFIAGVKHKGMRLEINFVDGNTYEYFGVTKSVYIKLMNSEKQMRFAKRSVFNSYLYRKAKKEEVEA
tara:strand:+ start:62728 stop:63177 length:450 start_codon:yes stop_codon:yes gene_type:complete